MIEFIDLSLIIYSTIIRWDCLINEVVLDLYVLDLPMEHQILCGSCNRVILILKVRAIKHGNSEGMAKKRMYIAVGEANKRGMKLDSVIFILEIKGTGHGNGVGNDKKIEYA